jgi:hypothetical protein
LNTRPTRESAIKIRASLAESARWHETAKAHGLTLSAWLRGLADDAVACDGNGRELATALVELRTEIGRGVGNNLNQLAHRANAGLSIHGDALDSALRDVQAMRVRVKDALLAVRPAREVRRSSGQ